MSYLARSSRFLSLLAALASATSVRAAPMAGTLVVLAGEVAISRSTGTPRRVADYARLEQGDQVTLDTASKARVSLFDSRSMVLLPGETYRVERDGIDRLRDGVGVQVLPFSVPLGTTGRARQFDVSVGGAGTLQVAGEVWVRSNTSQDWSPVGRDREVPLQAWVRTGVDGRAVLAAGNTGIMLVEQDTLVQLQGREAVLEYGGVLVRARRNSDTVQVHTTELHVESGGGIVRVVREAGAGTRVASFGHRAVVNPRQGRGRLVVHPGMIARVGPEGELLGTESIESARVVRDWRIELREKLDGLPPGLGERMGFLRDLLGIVHRTDDLQQPLARNVRLRAALGLDAPAADPAVELPEPEVASAEDSRPPRLAPPGLPEGRYRAPAPSSGHAARVMGPDGSVMGPARAELGGEASPLMRAPPAVSFDSPSSAPAPLAAPGAPVPVARGPEPTTVQSSGDWVVQVETGRSPRREEGAGIRSLAQAPPAPEPPPPRRRRRNPWDAAPSPQGGPEPGPIQEPPPMARPAIPDPIVTDGARAPSGRVALPPRPPSRAPSRAPTRAPTPTRSPTPTSTRTSEEPPKVAAPSRPSFGSDPLGGPSDLARAFQL